MSQANEPANNQNIASDMEESDYIEGLQKKLAAAESRVKELEGEIAIYKSPILAMKVRWQAEALKEAADLCKGTCWDSFNPITPWLRSRASTILKEAGLTDEKEG